MAGVYTNIAKRRSEQNGEAIAISPAKPQEADTHPFSPVIIKPMYRPPQSDKKPASGTPRTAEAAVLSANGYGRSLLRKKPNLEKPVIQKPNGRGYVRRTFDFYDDQIAFLRKSSLEEQLAGGEGSMNAMVRDALDKYIKEKTSAK